MKYHFEIHKEETGFWARGMELKGCFTQADSMEELQANMQEALNLYLQEPDDSEDLVPLPDATIRKSKQIVEVSVDPEIAAASTMRHRRITS